jgi:acyl dehydratase
MAEAGAVLVTDRLRDAIGVWRPAGKPSYPVEAGAIRRWAIAVYWPEAPPRIYYDEDYARGTRWGGIVAPPEFNPFAWPVRRAVESMPYHPAPREPAPNMLNGGLVMRFGAPIRPGDVITSRQRIASAEQKVGRFGETLWIEIERKLTNQSGEWVRTMLHTIVRH